MYFTETYCITNDTIMILLLWIFLKLHFGFYYAIIFVSDNHNLGEAASESGRFSFFYDITAAHYILKNIVNFSALCVQKSY